MLCNRVSRLTRNQHSDHSIASHSSASSVTSAPPSSHDSPCVAPLQQQDSYDPTLNPFQADVSDVERSSDVSSAKKSLNPFEDDEDEEEEVPAHASVIETPAQEPAEQGDESVEQMPSPPPKPTRTFQHRSSGDQTKYSCVSLEAVGRCLACAPRTCSLGCDVMRASFPIQLKSVRMSALSLLNL